MVVQLEDQGQARSGEIPCPCFQEAEGGGVGIAARFQCKLKVVAGVIRGRIGREGAGRTMLEPLVHRQDNKLSRAAKPSAVDQAGQVCQRTDVIAAVPRKYLLNFICHQLSTPADSIAAVYPGRIGGSY